MKLQSTRTAAGKPKLILANQIGMPPKNFWWLRLHDPRLNFDQGKLLVGRRQKPDPTVFQSFDNDGILLTPPERL
jgi:hypothetical protein